MLVFSQGHLYIENFTLSDNSLPPFITSGRYEIQTIISTKENTEDKLVFSLNLGAILIQRSFRPKGLK